MNLLSRIAALEQHDSGDGRHCPHQPYRLVVPDSYFNAYDHRHHAVEDPPSLKDLPPCTGGRPRLVVQIAYTDPKEARW